MHVIFKTVYNSSNKLVISAAGASMHDKLYCMSQKVQCLFFPQRCSMYRRDTMCRKESVPAKGAKIETEILHRCTKVSCQNSDL